MASRIDAKRFFDAFVEDFRHFDGHIIAERYLTPYLSIDTDGTLLRFSTATETGQYFQKIIDGYRQQGCVACQYKDLSVNDVSSMSLLATVTWELLREDNSTLSTWRESYVLVRENGLVKIALSGDHAVAII